MSNESNREDRRISPSELQASDFFPPGTGWNQDEPRECNKPARPLPQDDETAIDGGRPH
jgi:hypothetical protein